MSIQLAHQADYPDAYALSDRRARIHFRVAGLNSSARVELHFGDRYVATMSHSSVMEPTGNDGFFEHFVADVDVPTHRLKYLFSVESPQHDTVWYGESGVGDVQADVLPFHLPYLCKRDLFEVPDWAQDAVCYQIFPERFANGNSAFTPEGAVSWDATPTPRSMHGGDLPGITSKLDYLADLGVNLIYLTPIFKAGSNHKYDTTDYFAIDPQFGTEDDLTHLVEEAHRRGIRVVLDAVFNHAGFYFEPFQDAIVNGRTSRYWNWFFIDGDTVDVHGVNYETFGTKNAYMPKLNVANPDVEAYLLEVAAYWIERFDIDGWRLDVANEIDHVFWRHFRDVVKRAKPDALIVGEIWHDSLPWLRGDQFDSVMNYLFREHVLNLFVRRTIDPRTFAERMTKLHYQYPVQAMRAMFNLLGSHDTERILTLADGRADRVICAFAYMLTSPGIPMMYYGDEIGMTGGADPLCRAGMRWNEVDQHHGIAHALRRLVQLRHKEPALRSDKVAFLAVSARGLCVRRTGEDGAEVFVQFSMASDEVVVPEGAQTLFSSRDVEASRYDDFACHVDIWKLSTGAQ